jgi:NAD(P)-dependent dehydrogenase (short-subunit alcohol dehydrogenase family)
VKDHFNLTGRVAVVTGGSGALGGAIARGLAGAGAGVGILARRHDRVQATVDDIAASGADALALTADVLQREQLEAARDVLLARWGRIDILVNAAGGNIPEATLDEQASFFDLPTDAFERVFALNMTGTLLPSQVFGAAMVRDGESARGGSCIVNISSMAAQRAITRVVGYSAAKAAVENLTRWLAVDAARLYGDRLRVNAIAPGFFLGEQNRELLLTADGRLTARGQRIIDHTPAGRFGDPHEVAGAAIWLCGPSASFVTGVVVPVDGGFSAFSGI